MVKQKNTEMVKQLKIWKQKLFYQIGFPCWCRCRCRQTLTDIWVCQVVEHQQCAHRLLDRHTILTSSTMIWVTILIIVLHRESWEGFCCFKIFDISVGFCSSFWWFLLKSCWWWAPSGTWKLAWFLVCGLYFWYIDCIYGMLTIFLVRWPYFCEHWTLSLMPV